MNNITLFCAENNIVTDEDGIHFLEGCGTILGFMHEFSASYSKECFDYVKEVHSGATPDKGFWVEGESEYKWLESLRSIKTFPSYAVFMEFKDKVEVVLREWILNR